MKRNRIVWSLLTSLVIAAAASAEEVSVKSLAGPPEEFTQHRLPTSSQTAVPSVLLMMDRGRKEVAPKAPGVGVTLSEFSTTPGIGFTLVEVTTQYPNFRPATLTAPNGRRYDFDGTRITCDGLSCGEFQAGVELQAFVNQAPGGAVSFSISGGEVQGGTWQLAVREPVGGPILDGSLPQVETLIAFDDNAVQIEIEPDPCLARVYCLAPASAGRRFDLVAGAAPVLAVSFANEETRAKKLTRSLTLSELTVTVLDARTRTRLHEERYDASRLAALPRNGARSPLVQLPSLAAGTYAIRLDVVGDVAGVGRIERTGFTYLPILARSLTLTREVGTRVLDAERLAIDLGVDLPAGTSGHVYAYAEVWTRGGGKPVAWIGGMTEPQAGPGGRSVLPLDFDARWLALAGLRTSELELRNLRIHDPETFLPIDQLASLPLAVRELPRAALLAKSQVIKDVTLYQGKGDRTVTLPGDGPSAVRGGPFDTGILLVHGWCSGSVWRFADFDLPGRVGGTAFFTDFGQSRSHDAFARLIRDQGNASFPASFTVVAHSQGGAAATHLRAFYNSNLDLSNAPRRIQTMGTPYGGSTLMDLYLASGLAGWLAAEAFGSCTPPQFNLSTVGSLLWQAALPGFARNDVFYFQTTHSLPRNFWQALQFWRWNCGIASYLIPGPDDGVVSFLQGLFAGGHAQGVTQGECHVRNPRQTWNTARNDVMDREGRPAPVPPPTLQAACAVERIFHSSGSPSGGPYTEYWVNASGSTPGAFPIASYAWTINGAGGTPGTQVRVGPFLPGFPGQAGNYWVTVTVADTSGATSGATCSVP